MNYIRRLHLNRRTVLQGAFGATLTLPFLEAMVPAMANAQTAVATASPKRLGFFFFPLGCIHSDWTPKETGVGYTMMPAFDALKPNRSKINVLTGLACDPSKTRQGFHDRAIASFLTGVEKSKSEVRVGQSIDQVAAEALGTETPFGSLELAGEPNSPAGGPNYKTATQPLPVETSPRMLFERLFGDTDRVDSAALAAIQQREQSVLDLLTSKIDDVRRNVGTADQRKLDEYLDSVRDIERRLSFSEEFGEKLAREGLEVERPPITPDGYEHRINLLFDLLLVALRTDMTRVYTFMMHAEQSNMTFPQAGWNSSHHQTSHHLFDPIKMAAMTRISNYQAGLYNDFLTRVDAIEEENGSLLDNMLMIYGSDLGDANNHMQVDLPILLAGGANMGVKGNRHIVVPQDTPITNLYMTMLHKAGVEIDQFGDSTGDISDV